MCQWPKRRWAAREKCSDSLEGKGATVELLGSAEAGLLGWRAAEQQELMRGVHELQLLPRRRRWRGQEGTGGEQSHYIMRRWSRRQARGGCSGFLPYSEVAWRYGSDYWKWSFRRRKRSGVTLVISSHFILTAIKNMKKEDQFWNFFFLELFVNHVVFSNGPVWFKFHLFNVCLH